MGNFILTSTDDTKKIVEFKKTKSYTFCPKTKRGHFHSLKTVNVFDKERIQKIIINKYTIKYTRLLKVLKSVVESEDSTEGDVMICLDELSKLESILTIKYQEFLRKEAYEYFLKDLCFLEQVLRNKLLENRNQELYTKGGK